MRVAVYAPALDEAAFVARWFESTKEADFHLIADTGSTDDTVKIARDLGITVVPVNISPWRFDMARNAALAALPLDIDYCIPLDLDEVMVGDWRTGLEREWAKGVTRPRYHYTFSWHADGTPGIQFFATKIHTRKGYRWKYPVHEVPEPYGITETVSFNSDIVMLHLPDPTKSRGSYLPLLQMAAQEEPSDPRCAYYLGREYHYRGMPDEATVELKRYLALPGAVWDAERAHACRWLSKTDPANTINWLHKAIEERPSREVYADLTWTHYQLQQWPECLAAAEQALKFTEPPADYQSDGYAWGSMVLDVGSVAAYRMGLFDKALSMAEQALTVAPDSERIQANIALIQRELISDSTTVLK